MIWVCTKCGYEVESDKRPDLCAMCYAAMHHMIPKKEEEQPEEKKDRQRTPPAERALVIKQFIGTALCR